MEIRLIRFKRYELSILIFFIICSLFLIGILFSTFKSTLPQINVQSNDETTDSYRSDNQIDPNSQNKQSKCDTIHLALICGGSEATRSLYTLLKSILFYRKQGIHLHLMVNDISRTILTGLLDTSQIPQLDVTYYDASKYEAQISWITNHHYSNRYGLLKLAFLEVLADKTRLSKVILLDTDMLVLGDIRQLWDSLTDMVNDEDDDKKCKLNGSIFGMVENQSDWYLLPSTENRIVWPALGRGFNSGLILVDLKELMCNDWQKLWRQVTETHLISNLATSLADQDILNAIIWQNNHFVRSLPASFNIQLNDNSKITGNDSCSSIVTSVFQLVHWNSPYKLETKNVLSDHYRLWHETFVNWNGALLKHTYPCKFTSKAEFSPIYDEEDQFKNNPCNGLKLNPNKKLRTFLYFLNFEYNPEPWDVTLTVHLSSDRLLALDQLAGNWLGPISVAIYMDESETSLFLSSIKSSFNLANRTNIGYHLVFRDHGFNYPINKLRNIALDNAITGHVLLTDVDFLPSLNLYDYLKTTIAHDKLNRKALVIPAFETMQYKFDFPTSKAELLTQLNLGSITTFRAQLWPRGHSATDYSRWITATKPYQVDWTPDYEPFIVVSKDTIRFDERFFGFGWNKVQSVMELAASGYQFTVLPKAFLVHKIHSASYDILNHRQSHKYRLCISQLKRSFHQELSMKYPEFFRNFTLNWM